MIIHISINCVINLWVGFIPVKWWKQWWAKYSQEDYAPDRSNPVSYDIYNNFYRFPEKKFSEILDTILIHHSAGKKMKVLAN